MYMWAEEKAEVSYQHYFYMILIEFMKFIL